MCWSTQCAGGPRRGRVSASTCATFPRKYDLRPTRPTPMRTPRVHGGNNRKKAASASLVFFQRTLTALHTELVGEALFLADSLDLERYRVDRLLQVLDAALVQLRRRRCLLLPSPRSTPGHVPGDKESNV